MLGLPNLGVNSAQVPLEARVASLFANGEEGAWYDPSNLSTLYQNSAGTTPVTALGQPVGLMLDKSGRGNHASQPTSTARPTLQADASGRKYLQFDGVDDFLVTGNIDFTGTDKMTVVAGVRRESALAGMVVELGTGGQNGSFYIADPINATAELAFASKGTAWSVYEARSLTTPATEVLTMAISLSGASVAENVVARVNGAVPVLSEGAPGPAGGGNFGDYPLYIGRRGGSGLPFTGRIYSLIVRGALSTQAQIEAAERYANSKTGAF